MLADYDARRQQTSVDEPRYLGIYSWLRYSGSSTSTSINFQSNNLLTRLQHLQPTSPSTWVSGVGDPSALLDGIPYADLDFLDNNEDSYKQVYENDNFEENKSSFGHELVAGGAAFAGFKVTTTLLST